MEFEPARILPEFDHLDPSITLVVALSGGLDSMVLLHALQSLHARGSLPHRLGAIHVNHRINPDATRWQAFCETVCRQLQIPLQCVAVDIRREAGQSLEALAREARYRQFAALLDSRQCLLLAHHLDDQLETLLLRLNRGAGPGGLAGMPRRRQLGQGTLLRPLMGFQREHLLAYARGNRLERMEDSSNSDTDIDRNFWRKEIVPSIRQRFPGFHTGWQNAMALCREADELLGELASADLATMSGEDSRILHIQPLLALSEPRQRNALRHWMHQQGLQPPGRKLLVQVCRDLLSSQRVGAKLDCAGASIARFGELLVLLRRLPLDRGEQLCWNPAAAPTVNLPANGALVATLSSQPVDVGKLLPPGSDEQPLEICYRRGGELVRLAGRPARTLKKIMQDSNRPPWLRSRQPVLCRGSEVVCIPGVGVVEGCQADPDEPGLAIDWQVPELLFRGSGAH